MKSGAAGVHRGESIEPRGGRERRHGRRQRGREEGEGQRGGGKDPAPQKSRGGRGGGPKQAGSSGGPGETAQRGYRGPGGARSGPLLLLPERVPGPKQCPSPAVSCMRRFLGVCCTCLVLSSPACRKASL